MKFFSKWYVKLIIWFGICGAIIFLGILFSNKMVYTCVYIDANPSITMKLDREGLVLGVTADNADGKEVISELDIKGQDPEEAMYTLVTSMLDYGFVNEEQSAILVSVKCPDEEIAEEMQYLLAYSAEEALYEQLENGVILDQMIYADSTVRGLAGKFKMTQGKAYLLYQLCSEEEELSVYDLAEMTITELIQECIQKDVDLSYYVDIIGDGLLDYYEDFEDEEYDDYWDDLPAPDFEDDEDDEFEDDEFSDEEEGDEDWEDEDLEDEEEEEEDEDWEDEDLEEDEEEDLDEEFLDDEYEESEDYEDEYEDDEEEDTEVGTYADEEPQGGYFEAEP